MLCLIVMLQLYWLFCSVFLIMSQVTVANTTPSGAVVCSGSSTITMTITMAYISMELAAALDQHDVVQLPPLTPRDTIRGVVCLNTMPQQQP